MTTLTSPTNESYSIAYSNINTLSEESGIADTPKQTTEGRKKYVEFESYIDEERPKNQLVIIVEDSFECKVTDLPGMRGKAYHTGFAMEKLEQITDNREKEYQEKINILEETIRILKKEKQELVFEIEGFKEMKQDYTIKHEHFKQIIWKKDQTISGQKEIIESLNQKMIELEKDNMNTRFYEEKNKEKDMKLRELVKRLEKVLHMNRSLEIEVKESREKIMGLEKQIQMNAYNQILENRVKIKESMAVNKENTVDQNQRKSFQNPTRKGRLSNISGLAQKTKSNSNTGRLRH